MNPVTDPIATFTGTEFKLSMAKDCKILNPTIYLKGGTAGDEY